MLLDRTSAQAEIDRFWGGMFRVGAATALALVFGFLAMVLATPLSIALDLDPRTMFATSSAIAGISFAFVVATVFVGSLTASYRAITWAPRLREARRVLEQPGSQDPAWIRLERLIRSASERADEPTRDALRSLHALLAAEAELAIDHEAGSAADHAFRDRLGRAERTVRALHEQLAGGEADLADLTALLDARAEVEDPRPERLAAARRARAAER